MCGGGKYCPGDDMAYNCPSVQSHKRTTFPDNYYNPTISSIQMISRTGLKKSADCYALTWMRSSRGSLYEYAFYNPDTEEYDTRDGVMYGWSSVTAGYYLTGPAACGAYAYYSDAKECPAGSYCPGKAEVICNSENRWTVQTQTFGLEACPAGTYSGAGAVECNTCSNSKPENANYIGNATDKVCPWECRAGYYGSSANGDVVCADCGDGYYCTGGAQRVSCTTTVSSDLPPPKRIFSVSNGFPDSWYDRNHGTRDLDCYCDWEFSDETRNIYINEGSCLYGIYGPEFTAYSDCRTGYYAADPLGWGGWYTSCRPCTNKPEHSTYTSYSTPSSMYAVEDNCPWRCDDGYGLGADGKCAPLCDAGITHIRAGDISIPLFAEPQSMPAINVRVAGGYPVCYGMLATGRVNTGLNIKIGDTVYHAVQ